MRRMGRALLRAPWMRRAAALTVALGLLGGNSVMLASTVFAATSGPGLGLNLGSLNLGSSAGETGDEGISISIPEAACQLLPVLCQAGTTLVEIPSGVVTLGSPPPAPAPVAPAPAHHLRHNRVSAPRTGCILGLVGCGGTSTPTSKPAASTAPSPASATASSPSPQSSPTAAATPTPSASASNCGLLGLGVLCPPTGVSGSSTGQPTPTPAPSQGLCLLSCNLVQLGGNCLASVIGTCVGSQAAASNPAPGGSSSGPASSGACVGTLLCLLGSSCTASVGNTCLLGAILPALPGSSQGSPSQPSGPPTSSGGGGSGSGSGSVPQGGEAGQTGTTSQLSVVGLVPAGSSQPSAAGGNPAPSTSLTPKGDESVGLVSGLSFGHGLILWPLFGLLDLAALAGLVVVVRRRWSATSS